MLLTSLATLLAFQGSSAAVRLPCTGLPRAIGSCREIARVSLSDSVLSDPTFVQGKRRDCVLAWKAAKLSTPSQETLRERVVIGWCRRHGGNWTQIANLLLPSAMQELRGALIDSTLVVFWGIRDRSDAPLEATSIAYASLEGDTWSPTQTLFRASAPGTFLWWRASAVSDIVSASESRLVFVVPVTGGIHTSGVLVVTGDQAGTWNTHVLPVSGIAYASVAASKGTLAVGLIGAAPGPVPDQNSVSVLVSSERGRKWSLPQLLHRAGSSAPAYEIDLFHDQSGAFGVLWREEAAAKGSWRLRYALMASDGRWSSPRKLLLGDKTISSGTVSVAMNSRALLGILHTQYKYPLEYSHLAVFTRLTSPRVRSLKWSIQRARSQLVRTSSGGLAIISAVRKPHDRRTEETTLYLMTLD